MNNRFSLKDHSDCQIQIKTTIATSGSRTCRLIYFCLFFFQRVALFHAYSMSAMCKAGFDVIDVYSLSDSYPKRCIDHVHYKNIVFYMMETMLEKYKVNYNKKVDENEKHDKIKRCMSTQNF